MNLLTILAVSIVAGILGSMLGLGGGMIVTPVLTVLMGMDIKYAIGASIVSVIATSSGAAVAYIHDGLTNLRAGMFLEIGTTLGALTGVFVGMLLSGTVLSIIFGLLLIYSAINMLFKLGSELPHNVRQDPLATKLKLAGAYHDARLGREVPYHVDHVIPGMTVMYGAGVASGLLGIGSGAFKVMALDVFMKMPLKVSSATSNFMMGVTAAASAGVYFLRGTVDPAIAGPVAVGILIGALLGARIMQRLKSKTLRLIFIPVILYLGVQMIGGAVGWF